MSDSTALFVTTLQEWFKVCAHRARFESILYARERQLSRSQMGTLFLIHLMGSCSVSDIADPLDITPAAASQAVDRLVQRALIERKENPEDRRAKLLSLTDHGRQLLDDGTRAHLRWLAEFAHTLSPAEQARVTDALRLLLDRAEAFDVHRSEKRSR